MSALLFSFLASVCASAGNLFFRRSLGNISRDTQANGYLAVFYFLSFVFFFYPEIWHTPFDLPLFSIGACVGIFNVTLMLLTAKALNAGPSGLTFAFQNASAVFPGMVLFLSFGSDFGFSFSPLQLLGICLVLMGMFIGAKNETGKGSSISWLKYAIACFIVQIFALTLIQGRCLLFDANHAEHVVLFFSRPREVDAWFLPGQFGTAFLLQFFLFLREKRLLQKNEAFYGTLGGLANFGSSSMLLLATMVALPFEKGILFPCFAVGSILLSNLWGLLAI